MVQLLSVVRDLPVIEAMPWLGCREPFSSVTHLMGSAVYAGLAVQFIGRGRGDWIRTTSLSIMAIASVLLLFMSGMYHFCWPGPAREIMLRIDVVSVFLLIAASMTPGQAILFTGPARWGSLAVIWTTAILGITWRLMYWDTTHGTPAMIVFLIFGWASVLSAIAIWRRYGWTFVQPAILSGLVYTAGAIVLARHSPTLVPGLIGPHEIWHVAVLAGIGLQWYFVSQFASGDVKPAQQPVEVLVGH